MLLGLRQRGQAAWKERAAFVLWMSRVNARHEGNLSDVGVDQYDAPVVDDPRREHIRGSPGSERAKAPQPDTSQGSRSWLLG